MTSTTLTNFVIRWCSYSRNLLFIYQSPGRTATSLESLCTPTSLGIKDDVIKRPFNKPILDRWGRRGFSCSCVSAGPASAWVPRRRGSVGLRANLSSVKSSSSPSDESVVDSSLSDSPHSA